MLPCAKGCAFRADPRLGTQDWHGMTNRVRLQKAGRNLITGLLPLFLAGRERKEPLYGGFPPPPVA